MATATLEKPPTEQPAAPAATTPPAAAPQAAPPSAPAAEAKAEEKPVDKQLQEAVRGQFKSLMRGVKPEKPAEAKEPEKKADDVKVEAKPAEVKEPEKKTIKVGKKEKTEAADLVRIATNAATEAATRVTAELSPRKPEPEKKAGPPTPLETIVATLPENYRDEIPVLEMMEKKFPQKYTGITLRYAQSAARADAYQKQWEKENPGKEFDSEEDEHNTFFNGNEVDWSDVDYGRAMAALETESIMETERRRMGQKISEMERREAARDLEPVLREKQAVAAKAMIRELDPEFEAVIRDDGRINSAELTKLEEKNPARAGIIMQAASTAARFLYEAEKIFDPRIGPGHYKEAEPLHMEIHDLLVEVERAVTAEPASRQIDDKGRSFATRRQYLEMNDREKARHWQVDATGLAQIRAKQLVDEARNRIDGDSKAFAAMVERMGYTRKAAEPDKPPEKKEQEPKKPETPSSQAPTKTDTAAAPAISAGETFSSRLKSRMRGVMVP